MAAGDEHTCGLTTEGRAVCWGDNPRGQTDPPQGTFTAVTAGERHSCALTTEGRAVCWGDNTYGQLDPPQGTFTSIAAGEDHTCALTSNGRIVCWGSNGWDQTDAPQGTFTKISAGANHTCAISDKAEAVCWGSNSFGRADPPQGTFTSIAAGWGHSCAIADEGQAICWGHNDDGQASVPALYLIPQETATAIGDVLVLKSDFLGIHLEVRVLEVVRGIRGGWISDVRLDDGNEWIKIVVEVKNLGERRRILSSNAFVLVDANGEEFGLSDSIGGPSTTNDFLTMSIEAGATEIGDVVRQASAEVGYLGLTFVYVPGRRHTSLTSLPSIPQSVGVVDRTDSSLRVSWSETPNADNQLYRSYTRDDGYSPVASNLEGGEHIDGGLKPSETYYYKVRACNEFGCSPLSRSAGGVTEPDKPIIPQTPANVEGHKIDISWGTDTAAVSWETVKFATYYEIYQDGSSDAVRYAPAHYYQDSDPNTIWGSYATTRYAVRACNKYGCSALSPYVTVH